MRKSEARFSSTLLVFSWVLFFCSPLDLRSQDQLARKLADQTDLDNEPQVHVMYVLPNGATDREIDENGDIEESVGQALDWMEKETAGYRLRFDRQKGGELDITFLQLSDTHEELVERSETPLVEQIDYELWAAGFKAENKLYVVYYGGDVEREDCGTSNNRVALLAPLTKKCPVDFPSPAPPSEWEYTLIHESFHLLGAVPPGAPHFHKYHANDSFRDLMSADYWHFPPFIDWKNNDYFNHGRQDLLDVARSAFLTGGSGSKDLPPGWPIVDATIISISVSKQVTSMPGSGAALLNVGNLTDKPIRLYWIDYSGDRAWFQILYPADVLSHQTMKGAVWQVTDEAGKTLGTFRVNADNVRYVLK